MFITVAVSTVPCASPGGPPDYIALQTLCIADPICEKRYEQLPFPSLAVFEYLLMHNALQPSIEDAWDVLFCNHTIEAAIDAFAPVIMAYWASLEPMCGPNYVYRLVPPGPTGECQCIPGADCSKIQWCDVWQLLLLISLSLLIVMLSGLLIRRAASQK
jgi:hypothetical protein